MEFMDFMSGLEERFQKATSLKNRSEYKIYYCQVRPAAVLTLGKNPGGSPDGTSQDGCIDLVKRTKASSSVSYFENGEHDVLDCEWNENTGLRKLLLPLFSDNRERIRREVVKTNLAFQRSTNITRDQASFEKMCAPYLDEIIGVVRPKLILLTGPNLSQFCSRFGSKCMTRVEPVKDADVKQIVFAPAKLHLRKTGEEAVVVQVAHASQFSWTYERYHVADKIRSLFAISADGFINN
jgi:hypothetical protein